MKPVPHTTATPPLPGSGLLVALCVLFLAGCGLGVSTEERLARAEQAFESGDYRAAAIDAKNVLRDEPDNVAARLLLGRTSIQLGDPVAAEKELRRAVSLGTPVASVAVDIARAQLLQGRYQELIDEADPDAQADSRDRLQLYRLIGDARLGVGQPEQAREAYAAAVELDIADREAQLGIVRTYIAEQNLIQARATLSEVLQADDGYAPAWIVSGQLHQSVGQLDAARGDYERARRISADNQLLFQELQALSGLSDISLAAGDLESASGYAAQLEELAPGNVRTLQLAARIAYAGGDLDLAQQKLLDVLRRVPDDAEARLMLGAIHLQNGNLGQAEMHLSALVTDQPANADARRLLAETRLQLDKLAEAADVLRPVVGDAAADTRSLELAARVSLESGDLDAATQYLERSIETQPDDPDALLNLVMAYLMADRVDDAERLLASVQVDASEQSGFRRDMLSVLTGIRRDESTAMTAATGLRDKWPGQAGAHNLHGLLLLNRQQLDAARDAFEAAQRVAPADLGSLRYLARIDEQEGDLATAEQRYRKLLERRKGDIDAMLGLARISARAGDPAAAIDWLEKARAADASALAPRVLLGKLYVTVGRHAEAATIMAEALAISDDIADVHNVNGLALLGSGDAAAALVSFERAADLDPKSADYRLNVARALAAGGDEARAMETLNKSDEETFKHLPSGVTLAQLRARDGDLVGAVGIAERLRALHPSSVVPVVLTAELNILRGDLDSAVALYDDAIALDSSLRIVVRAYAVRKKAGASDVLEPLLDYLRGNPDDVNALLVLATHHQQAGADGDAQATYERVLEISPDNFVAVNNLAWMYFERQDSRAEELARRAYALAPDNGSVVDTLGWILVRDGRATEGVELLRKAVDLDPRPEIEYHLAAGLAATGNGQEARDILERILADDATFNSRDDAETLLASL